MQLLIADSGPVNYLVLIGCIDVLPGLFEKVILPSAVHTELTAAKTPLPVKAWVSDPPAWLEVRNPVEELNASQPAAGIHAGEREAIALAAAFGPDMLLMDDRRGVALARQRGIRVTGTLGILELAAFEGLINFEQAITKLRQTNFRCNAALIYALLEKHARGGGKA